MRELLRRLRYLIRYRRDEDDLAEELEFHREMKQRQLERNGLDPASATAAARKALGNAQGSRQYARDVWIAPWLQEVAQDVRFGMRVLGRERAFAALAILMLGLGIGINNMFFTVLHAHTMRGLPLSRAERLLHISSVDERTNDRPVSFAEFQDLRTEARSFAALAAFWPSPLTVGDEGRAPDRFEGAYVSADAFAVLGIAPVLGRSFVAADDHRGAAPVAILGSGAWHSRYGGNPALLGRSILINGSAATVIGVMAPASGFPSTAEVWLPLSRAPGLQPLRRDARMLRVFGRLRDGVSIEDARAETQSIFARWSREHPESSRANHPHVVSLNERVLGRSARDPTWLAFMAFGCLALLISCANVATLMLARAVHRGREIAVRASLGATRLRVIRQLLVESAVIAAIGSLVGVGVSLASVRLFRTAIPPNVLPYWLDYEMNAAVLGALAAGAGASVFIFGLVPALYATKHNVAALLNAGGRGIVTARGPRRWMTTFTAIELALSVLMLSYLVRDVRAPRSDVASDAGIETGDVLTAAVTLAPETYRERDQRQRFYDQLQERLQSLPGSPTFALATALPRRGGNEQRLDVEGHARGAGDAAPSVWTVGITSQYFGTLALPLERGREFTSVDSAPDTHTVIVNRRFMDLLLDGDDPIGKRIRLTPTTPANAPASAWLTVIGVAQTIRQRTPRVPDPVVYLPFAAVAPATANLLLRSSTDQTTLTAMLRDELRGLDPNLPIYRVLTMAEVIEEVEWNGRASSRLVRLIAIIAFVFALVGLYAVTAHAVAQRSPEIGIRMALGARASHVGRMVFAPALLQVALGAALGLVATAGWDSMFGSGLEAQFSSPAVLGSIAGLLALGTLTACAIPARRAASLDPVVALRTD
jgi:putative ABC transport system permease protein